VRRKELRQPDEFILWTTRAARYLRAHAVAAAWIGASIAILTIGTAAVVAFRHVQASNANEALAPGIGALYGGRTADAAKLLGERSSRWRNSPVGPLGELYLASAELAEGKYEAVRVRLQRALPDLRRPYLRQLALLSLGYALEGEGDHASAAQRFAQAAELEGPYRAEALLGQARNAELANDPAQAKRAYGAFLESFPEAAEREFVEFRLARLG
jgi:predicted negative regulator of RcsB-dependent stress response